MRHSPPRARTAHPALYAQEDTGSLLERQSGELDWGEMLYLM